MIFDGLDSLQSAQCWDCWTGQFITSPTSLLGFTKNYDVRQGLLHEQFTIKIRNLFFRFVGNKN